MDSNDGGVVMGDASAVSGDQNDPFQDMVDDFQLSELSAESEAMVDRRKKDANGNPIIINGEEIIDDRHPFMVPAEESLPCPVTEEEQTAKLQQFLGAGKQLLTIVAKRGYDRPISQGGPLALSVETWRLVWAIIDLVNRADMTPSMRDKTFCRQTLRRMLMKDAKGSIKFLLPTEVTEYVELTLNMWEARKWSYDGTHSEPIKGLPDPVQQCTAGASYPKLAGQDPSKKAYETLPTNTRHYQKGGVAYGLVVSYTSRRNYLRDKSVVATPANRHGDNGLKVGDWWPLQIASLVPGAHGSSQGGIYGNDRDGAYSIVIAGMYAGLDTDLGDEIHYSSSQALENENSTVPIVSQGTLTLDRALKVSKPIRVLRSANGNGRYAPSYGIRYDGLYIITGKSLKLNEKYGAYESYTMTRLPGQDPIRQDIPSRQQIADLNDWKSSMR